MWFERSDGVKFEADENSASFKMMSKDASFKVLDDGKTEKSEYPTLGTEAIQTKAKSKPKKGKTIDNG